MLGKINKFDYYAGQKRFFGFRVFSLAQPALGVKIHQHAFSDFFSVIPMSYDKTTYINIVRQYFGEEIASFVKKEWKGYPDYEIKIRKRNDEGSIIFEKNEYNGNSGITKKGKKIPKKVKRINYKVIKTQLGFCIPEACIKKEEYVLMKE